MTVVNKGCPDDILSEKNILDSDSGSQGVKAKANRVPECQGVGLQGPRGSRDRLQGPKWSRVRPAGSQGVKVQGYRIQGDQGVGLQGPRESKGGPTGSQVVMGWAYRVLGAHF